jgi:hemerythrin-like domain-containing protein
MKCDAEWIVLPRFGFTWFSRGDGALLNPERKIPMKDANRRFFLQATAAAGLAAVMPAVCAARADDKKEGDMEEVGATEDLMREHGVLNRVLLIYEEGLRRLRAKEDVTPEVFHKCATLVRKFVEDYHEKLEENFIFPEFEKQKKLVDLVKVLRDQHQAGRKVTDVILSNAVGDQFRKEDARQELVRSCETFIRMYRPHEAREDTVLFPALHKIVPAKRLKELGDQFEKEEDRLFGDEGFEKTVDQVAVIEKQLGIYDLAGFTPK